MDDQKSGGKRRRRRRKRAHPEQVGGQSNGNAQQGNEGGHQTNDRQPKRRPQRQDDQDPRGGAAGAQQQQRGAPQFNRGGGGGGQPRGGSQRGGQRGGGNQAGAKRSRDGDGEQRPQRPRRDGDFGGQRGGHQSDRRGPRDSGRGGQPPPAWGKRPQDGSPREPGHGRSPAGPQTQTQTQTMGGSPTPTAPTDRDWQVPYNREEVKRDREMDALTRQMGDATIGDEKDEQMMDFRLKRDVTALSKYLPTRPSRPGRQGRPVDLMVNSYQIGLLAEEVTIYDVKFDPPIPEDAAAKRLFQLGRFRRQLDEIYGVCFFDVTRIWALQNVGEAKTLQHGDGSVIVLTPVRCINIDEIPSDEQIQVIHIILKKALAQANLIRCGRQYFDTDVAQNKRVCFDIKGGRDYPPLRIWRGYSVSAEPTMTGIHLKVDVSHKVLQHQSVLCLYEAICGPRGGGDRAKKQLEQEVKGCAVITLYNKRVWRITDIDWNSSIHDTFEKNGQNISYADYFASQYACKLQSKMNFMLIHEPRKPKKNGPTRMVLPPELCYLTGLSKKMKSNFFLMKEIRGASSMRPDQRHGEGDVIALRLRKAIEAVNTKSVKKKSGSVVKSTDLEVPLSVNHRPIQLKGRVLNMVHVSLGDPTRRPEMCPIKDLQRRWKGQYSNQNMTKIEKWFIVYERSCYDHANLLAAEVKKMAGIQRIWGRVLSPDIGYVEIAPRGPADADREWGKELRRVVSEAKPDFLFCIAPRHFKNAEVYTTIKKVCSFENSVVTQCIQESQIMKGRGRPNAKLYQVVGSILRQVMVKMGNVPWMIDLKVPDKTLNFKVPTMVVGIDVNHDVKRNTSTTTFCSSTGIKCTNYDTFIDTQSRGQELLRSAKQFMLDAIQNFYGVNNAYPQNIIVYRDGVSNSMLESVVRVEVGKMQEAFGEISKRQQRKYEPKLAVIVVQKRVSAKFIAAGRGAPPEPGTVVDSVVVSPQYWDFYLVTCKPPPGCSPTPTRYIVIHDDIGFSQDDIQALTFQLCHVYYNWTGPIRVPAVVQVAHKVAHLWGTAIKEDTKVFHPKFASGKAYYM